ncbi:MAG: hypothetical protein M3405_03400 [Acidobacteriota bacterium]|jgi:hypothetical protein|nr:hypothetical protein [Acidobacteriota bacterium]
MKRTPEEKLLNPKPGSKIAAAKEFGIDLTLPIKNLRLTPQERIENLQKSMRSINKFSSEAKKWREMNRDRTRISTKSTN